MQNANRAGANDGARSNRVRGYNQYVQRVAVTRVDGRSLAEPGTGALRVDVVVLWRPNPDATAREVTRTSWYRTP